MKTMEYKMRAECSSDVGRFMAKVSVSSISAKQIQSFPDMLVTFESHLTLNEIRKALKSVVDGHVMLETVNHAAQYTGERFFE